MRFLYCLVIASVTSGFVFAADRVETFGDWQLVCQSSASEKAEEEATDTKSVKGRQDCRLQQAQAVTKDKKVVFLFNVVLKNKKPVAVISVPLGVYLPAGMTLKVDKGRKQVAAFETCNLSGCHGGFFLSRDLLRRLKRGNVLSIGLKDTNRKDIPISVSLKGVTAGIAALVKTAA